jgi:hypothetical protein
MRWPGTDEKIRYVSRGDVLTAVRIVICVVLFWAFLSGGSLLSVRWPVILAVATALSMLTAYELILRDVAPGWVLGSVLFIQAGLGCSYLAWRYFQPPEPTGPLIAAGEASPPSGCEEKPDADDLQMVFGTDRVLGKGPGPFMPLVVDDCVVMKLDRSDNGLMVRAFGYDWNNDIAFRVIDNVYEPAALLQVRPFRPDRSTFVLLDRFDKEVLYVRYLNRNTVRIRGRFLCGEAPQAVIHDDVIQVGGVRIGGVFFGQRPTKGHVCTTIKAGAYGIAIKEVMSDPSTR